MKLLSHKRKTGRIFIGTTEIAGYYRNLAQGLTQLGVDFQYVQLSPNSSGYGTQSKLPFFIRLPYLIAKWRLKISVEPGLYTVHKTKQNWLSLLRFVLYVFEFLLRLLIVLPWAIMNFDIFCFGARSNIIGIKAGYWDVALLKRLGKRIIYVYHGSDGRPPYINGSIVHNLLNTYKNWDEKLSRLSRKTKHAVDKISKLADVIIDNPYSAHFQSKPFINWFSIGAPYYSDKVDHHVNQSQNKDKPLRILHAPTHRIAKGSAIIESCISKLQSEGYRLELIMIHGRPHDEVIDEIQKCDFIIDELYSDALMAGFAAEASFYAKPVIACGYVDDIGLKSLIPTYYCRPEELEFAVRKFIDEPNFRQELGNRAQHFIFTDWSYIKIAERFMRIFNDDIPDSWFIKPELITYLHGFGMPEALLKQCLLQYVNNQGSTALLLDDKPILRDAFLGFSNAG